MNAGRILDGSAVVNKNDRRARVLKPVQNVPSNIPQKHVPRPPVYILPNLSSNKTANDNVFLLEPPTKWKKWVKISEYEYSFNALRMLKSLRDSVQEVRNIIFKKEKNNIDFRSAMEICKKVDDRFARLENLGKMMPLKEPNYNFNLARFSQINTLIMDKSLSHDDAVHNNFDILFESLITRSYVEENIHQLNVNIHRRTAKRASCLAKAPPILNTNRAQSLNYYVFISKMVEKYMKSMSFFLWKCKIVNHPNYTKKCVMIECQYTDRRSSRNDFLPLLKAYILVQFGQIVDIVLCEPSEEVLSLEGLCSSRLQSYRNMSFYAKREIVSTQYSNIMSYTSFGSFNNYIQSFIFCFSSKCSACDRHLRHFKTPVLVTPAALSPVTANDSVKYLHAECASTYLDSNESISS